VAMTFRLTTEDSAALARLAALQERSQNDVLLTALREYVERQARSALMEQVMDSELPRYAEALERLGR